jgi:hypothetical protein
MVAHTRQFATNQGIKADLAAWNPIPWDHNDRTWPMPPDYPPGSHSPWKQNEVTVEYRDEAQTQLLSLPWLRTLSLDALGIQIETGIHNWLHLHWSADPWYRGEPGQDMNDIRNDWLADPYSSHVNKHFWKLHGWIDDRVRDWGFANEEAPDLSSAWCGPPHTMDPKPVLTVGELRLVKTIFFEGFNVP